MADRRRIRLTGAMGLIAGSLALLLLGSNMGGCGKTTDSDHPEKDTAMTSTPIEKVLEAHTDSLMALAGVQGVGQGECDGAPCIRVYASEKTPEIEREIPDSIEGYAVEVEVTGQIRPRSAQ